MYRLLLVVLSLILVFITGCDENNSQSKKNGNTESASEKNNNPAVRWKMAAAFPSSMVILGETGIKFTEKIDEVSGSSIKIKYFEPYALVPPLEIFDAVSSGSIDAGWSTPGYWAGKIPALQFFTTFPFGPAPGEYFAWLRYGGGNEIFRELYHEHNIHPIHCIATSPEASGWFRKEIKTVEDLKGLKMRFFGLGAKVMEKLGVSTQLLAGGDIYPALELGTIDATEFAMPAIDIALGFNDIADHYYFPGWHQPASLGELIINLDKWNSLSSQQRAQIEVTCGEMLLDSLANSEAAQPPAIKKLEELGVQIHKWSPEMIALFEEKWLEVVEEESEKNEQFSRVWNSVKKFRTSYARWRDLGYLK